LTIGCDIQSVLEVRGREVLLGNRALFTPYERTYTRDKDDPWPTLAGLFCAKEACVKALAAGPDDFGFLEIEIRHREDGRPRVAASGRLGRWLGERGLRLDVSISHSKDYAMAVATLVDTEKES
jgi:holo-[acyl-carrier-protein] synthase